MKMLVVMALLAMVPSKNYTPVPNVQKAGCYYHCHTQYNGDQVCHWNCY